MADNGTGARRPRVYPTVSVEDDIEHGRRATVPLTPSPVSKPTAPLLPKDEVMSNGNGASHGQTRVQVQLPRDLEIPRPVNARPASAKRPGKKMRKCSCCRCLCCTLAVLFMIVLVLAVAAAVLYLVFQPRLPKYSVSNLRVSKFEVDQSAHTVTSSFQVSVRARNPNKKIGIYYLHNGHASVNYDDVTLCSGAIPAFYQGHKNTTVLNLVLSGTNVAFDSAKQSQLQSYNSRGHVPLQLRAWVPIKIKFGSLKLFKMTFKLHCSLDVDRLSANSTPTISGTSCSDIKLKIWRFTI